MIGVKTIVKKKASHLQVSGTAGMNDTLAEVSAALNRHPNASGVRRQPLCGGGRPVFAPSPGSVPGSTPP